MANSLLSGSGDSQSREAHHHIPTYAKLHVPSARPTSVILLAKRLQVFATSPMAKAGRPDGFP